MNNKGQVLVVFVLLLPVMLLLLALVINVGYLYTEKRNIDNNIKSTIKYGLTHIEDDDLKIKMTNLLKENIDDIDLLYINISDNKITINLTKKQKGIFNIIEFESDYEITSKYSGYINGGKIELIKE